GKNQTYAEQVKNGEAKQFIWHSEKMQDGATTEYKKYIAEGGGDEAATESEDTSSEESEEDDGVL
ncbi:MAG: hypothetical protein DRQ78_12500, partial [Epsilonproteobacteria bacterium]